MQRSPSAASPQIFDTRDTNRGRSLEAALRRQRPVICAVDDDDLAAGVLATAAVLATQLALPLTVVHSPLADIYAVGELRRTALARGHAFLDELTERVPFDERIVELNHPVDLVLDVAAQGASMIVIGPRRRSGFRAALLGSVSQSVLKGAGCPVLIVPPAHRAAVTTTEAAESASRVAV